MNYFYAPHQYAIQCILCYIILSFINWGSEKSVNFSDIIAYGIEKELKLNFFKFRISDEILDYNPILDIMYQEQMETGALFQELTYLSENVRVQPMLCDCPLLRCMQKLSMRSVGNLKLFYIYAQPLKHLMQCNKCFENGA